MLRNLATYANRRQGIVLAVSLLGSARSPSSEAKKKRKGKKLGSACQTDDQCVRINAICGDPWATWCGPGTGSDVCCRSLGQPCKKLCDCCSVIREGDR